jgi:hypothetical protein
MGTGLKNNAITLPLESDDVLNGFIILVWITITALLYLSSSNSLSYLKSVCVCVCVCGFEASNAPNSHLTHIYKISYHLKGTTQITFEV